MTSLIEHARVLSIPPLFDEETAGDLLTRHAPGGIAESQIGARRTLDELRLAGLVVRAAGALRVADPLRSELRLELSRSDPGRYRQVLTSFVQYARNGFGATLEGALGREAAHVTVAVQAAVASDASADYGRLVESVLYAARGQRSGDIVAATRMLRQHPASAQSERHIALLLGLQLWNEGQRRSATREFERVARHRFNDTAFGIASHLLGTYRHERGDQEAALPLLQQSVATLEAIGDLRGLHLALTTLGRVLRDMASGQEAVLAEVTAETPDSILALYEEALDSLERAVSIGKDLRAPGVSALVPLIELAVTYRRMGALAMAVEVAEQGLDLLNESDPHSVWALTISASLYRELGDDQCAGELIDRAVDLARERGTATLDLARALNVLANIERRKPAFADAAVRHAEESVSIGRQLRSDRHVSQALHTYAVALLSRRRGRDVQAAGEALEEAERLLGALQDDRGLRMVQRTREARLDPAVTEKATQRKIGFSGPSLF